MPSRKRSNVFVKLAIAAVVLVGLGYLFIYSLETSLSEPYTVEPARLGPWTLVIEAADGPGAPLLSLRTSQELVAGLFRQLFQRKMESMNTPVAAYGATLIAISSLFNGVGRLFWGMISDRIGRVESFRLLLATQMLVFGMLMTERDPWIFSALVCYILLCFGGGFGTMPSFVIDVFGTRRMSVMYGFLLTAWAAAGVVGPLLVASVKDLYPDRAVIYCFLVGVLFLGAGFIFSFLAINDRCSPGKPALDDLGIPPAYLPAARPR